MQYLWQNAFAGPSIPGKRRPGRPKGSKDRMKRKKGSGRQWGSRNKKTLQKLGVWKEDVVEQPESFDRPSVKYPIYPYSLNSAPSDISPKPINEISLKPLLTPANMQYAMTDFAPNPKKKVSPKLNEEAKKSPRRKKAIKKMN